MERAIKEWLALPNDRPGTRDVFANKVKRSYVVYGCMILLPLDPYYEAEDASNAQLHKLYELIAKHLKATHVAVTRPIPSHSLDETADNVIRAPSNFTPLYGDFGPTTCHDPPSQADFDAAFWVTAKQNGIYQTWAPRWTMFSRGNLAEKARLLTLPAVSSAVEDGRNDGRGSAAVDLYAGIGYFAFSYVKAGVSKVLCWDLNAWSVEGLLRGAKANKWKAELVSSDDALAKAVVEEDIRLLYFNESNEHAARRIEKAREQLPPIRHVNCGLLPTSKGSWPTAVRALDPELGGWVHVHENLAVSEIEQKAEEVRKAFEQLLGSSNKKRSPQLEHIHRLKSYAPGVMHCVLDIHIPSCTA